MLDAFVLFGAWWTDSPKGFANASELRVRLGAQRRESTIGKGG